MTDHVTPKEAKKAIESVVKMEGAALRRATPTRWLGAGVSLAAGALVGLAVFLISERARRAHLAKVAEAANK